MTDIEQRLAAVHARIANAERLAGRQPGSVGLVAVSKTAPIPAILAAVRADQRAFGESYIQEASAKIQALRALNLQWHFIGPIQSNKTRSIAEQFSWVHSVDRIKIAERLNEQRPASLPPLNVCIQVNVSHEQSKSGVSAIDSLPLARAILALPRLRFRGLMTIPRATDDVNEQRASFHLLAQLRQTLEADLNVSLGTLSMGMSSDLDSAIAEGATLVRVGTDIFGARTATNALTDSKG